MTEISGHNCETAIEVKKGIEDGYGVGDGDGDVDELEDVNGDLEWR